MKLGLVSILFFSILTGACASQAAPSCRDYFLQVPSEIEDWVRMAQDIGAMPPGHEKISALREMHSKRLEIWSHHGRDMANRLFIVASERMKSDLNSLAAPKSADNWISPGRPKPIDFKPEKLKKVLTKKFAEGFHTLDDTYVRDAKELTADVKVAGGSGVMWTADDRFVAMRDFSKGGTFVYDTKERRKVKLAPKAGVLAVTGKYFAEEFIDGGATRARILDLTTETEVAVVPGQVEYENFNDNYVISFTHIPSQKYNLSKDRQFHLTDLRTGLQLDLGIRYGVSRDGRFVATWQTPDEISIFDLAGANPLKEVKKIKGVRGDWTGRDTGFIAYERDGKDFWFSLDSFREIEANRSDDILLDGQVRIVVSKKGKSKVMSVSKEGQEPLVFRGFDEFHVSDDGQKIVIYEFSSMKSNVLDLMSFKSLTVDGKFDRFSPNGRFLYHYGAKDYRIWDLQSGIYIDFKAGFHLDFIGQSNLILYEDAKSKKRFIMDAVTGISTEEPVGFNHHGVSPSGRYIMTLTADERLQILQFPEAGPAR